MPSIRHIVCDLILAIAYYSYCMHLFSHYYTMLMLFSVIIGGSERLLFKYMYSSILRKSIC